MLLRSPHEKSVGKRSSFKKILMRLVKLSVNLYELAFALIKGKRNEDNLNQCVICWSDIEKPKSPYFKVMFT